MTTVNLDELTKAAGRVGSNGRQQLEWALRLVYDPDVKSWGAGRWRDLQIELGLFRGAGKMLSVFRKGAKLPVRHPIFPDEQETKKIHKALVDSLAGYSARNEIVRRWTGATSFTLRDGRFDFAVGDLVVGCLVKFMSLLGEFSDYVRQCAKCNQWFVGRKPGQTFCSKRCGAYSRTIEFRKRQRRAGK